MVKISLATDLCKPGDMFAEDIYNPKGQLLVAKNTLCNNYIKTRLLEIGISNIMVYHNDSSPQITAEELNVLNAFRENVCLFKEVLASIAKGGSLDLNKVQIISKNIFQGSNYTHQVLRFLVQIKKADEYTFNHSIHVAFYCMLMAKWLNLNEQEIKEVILAGLLHDIGKVQVPLEILNKPGKLSSEEYEIMKQHSLVGYNMIKDKPSLDDRIKEAVLSHHERLDGSGYPNGKSGDDISLYTRILSIADVYDAMTQDRVYKKKATPFKVFDVLKTIAITSFDVHVINTFLSRISVYYTGMHVKLNTGEIGKIVFIPPYDVVYPIVQVGSKFYDLAENPELQIEEFVQ